MDIVSIPSGTDDIGWFFSLYAYNYVQQFFLSTSSVLLFCFSPKFKLVEKCLKWFIFRYSSPRLIRWNLEWFSNWWWEILINRRILCFHTAIQQENAFGTKNLVVEKLPILREMRLEKILRLRFECFCDCYRVCSSTDTVNSFSVLKKSNLWGYNICVCCILSI